MLEKLDLLILDNVFQTIADWWMDQTGKNNFWLARDTITLSAVLFFVFVGFNLSSLNIVCGILVLPIFYKLVKSCEKAEKQSESFGKCMNPLRNFAPHGIERTVFVLLFILNTSFWVMRCLEFGFGPPMRDIPSLLGFALYICGMYFAACTPKPPSRLKAGNKLATHSA